MKTISIRFDQRLLARIKRSAKKNGVGISTEVKRLAKIGMGLALLLLIVTPAHAVTVLDLRLNCAGAWLEPGVTLTSTSCGGQGLWIDARLTGWPVITAPVVRLALTLDGVIAAEETRTLPADLGPCQYCQFGYYTGMGLGWRLPLDDCCTGRLVRALASLELIGGSDPEVEFTLDVPTPEPSAIFLFGSSMVALGLWWKRRRR